MPSHIYHAAPSFIKILMILTFVGLVMLISSEEWGSLLNLWARLFNVARFGA